MGLQRWPLNFVQQIANATCVSPSPAGPPGSSPPSSPVQSEFHDRNAKKVLHVRSEDEPMFCMQLPLYA